VVIAGLSGHGEKVGAAARRLQQALRQYIDVWDQLELIRDLNEFFFRNEHRVKFATAFLGSFASESGALLFTNARHTVPLFYPAATQEWSYLQDFMQSFERASLTTNGRTSATVRPGGDFEDDQKHGHDFIYGGSSVGESGHSATKPRQHLRPGVDTRRHDLCAFIPGAHGDGRHLRDCVLPALVGGRELQGKGEFRPVVSAPTEPFGAALGVNLLVRLRSALGASRRLPDGESRGPSVFGSDHERRFVRGNL